MLTFKAFVKALASYLKKNLSVVCIILMALTVTEVHLNLVRHKQQSVLAWDVAGYYGYLPAAFIEKDLKLSFITPENKSRFYGTRYAYSDDAQGRHVFKYSMGMAVLYAPFFFAAHLLAEPLGYTADGYSEIYHLFVEYSGLFYLVFGLIFLRRLLLLYYSETVTACCLLALCFGSNLLCYATIDAAMSHAYTFSLFSVLLYLTVRYYLRPKLSLVLYMALLSGLIVLVRPVNLLLLLSVGLVGVGSFRALPERLRLLLAQWRHVLAYLLVTGLVALPQLLYWHYVTGHYLVFSYGEERFFFGHPHMLDCLLGFRKGWLIYSPVFLFALAGLYLMRRQASSGFQIILLILLPPFFYLLACWWCWWYGGSFGLRPMIDLYPLLAIPLAACLSEMQGMRRPVKQVLWSLFCFFIALNIYQTFQYRYNIIHYDAMTARAYVNVIGRMSRSEADTTLLRHPDYDRALKGLE